MTNKAFIFPILALTALIVVGGSMFQPKGSPPNDVVNILAKDSLAWVPDTIPAKSSDTIQLTRNFPNQCRIKVIRC